MSAGDTARPEMSWAAWGDPAAAVELPDAVVAMLGEGLGVRGPGAPAGEIAEVRLPESRLAAEVRAQLAAAVGAEGIAIEIDDDYYRTKHESLRELGTGFAIAELGFDKLPEPSSDPEFRLKAGALDRAKLDEAEALYPRRRAPQPAAVAEPVAPVAPPRPKGLFRR